MLVACSQTHLEAAIAAVDHSSLALAVAVMAAVQNFPPSAALVVEEAGVVVDVVVAVAAVETAG